MKAKKLALMTFVYINILNNFRVREKASLVQW
jgi:hypothetical protein